MKFVPDKWNSKKVDIIEMNELTSDMSIMIKIYL